MNVSKGYRKTAAVLCVFLSITMIGSAATAKQAEHRGEKIERQLSPPSGTMQGICGPEVVFDRNAGRMVRKKRADLIVTKVEFKRTTGDGVAVKATVKNRCPNTFGRDVSVSIDDVAMSVGTPPPNTPVSSSWIVMGTKTSYRVEVDHGNQVKEIDERNNVCIATFPLSMASKTHRCR